MSVLLSAFSGDVEVLNDVRTVDGVDIHARRAPNPQAPAVVLVHGMVVSSRYFVPTIRELAGVADVWAPDLVGHGRSGRTSETLTVPVLAENLLSWMAAAGIESAVVVANSFGCQVAVEAAMRKTDAVRALVLNGPTTDPQARTRGKLMARWLRTSTQESMLQLPLLVRDYLQFGPLRAREMIDSVLDDAIEEKLPHITQPTAIVCGERDAIAPRDWAEEVVRLLPHGRLVMVPDAAHTLNFTHPTELAAVVAELVAS